VNGAPQPTPLPSSVDAVLVIGAEDSGTDLVHGLLCRLGLRPLGAGEPSPAALRAFNDRLLDAAGGSRTRLPEIAPREAARLLERYAADARRCIRDAGGAPAATGSAGPWVWSDPANSLLASFWAQALDIEIAVVLVHRDPAAVAASSQGLGALDRWDRYNRAAVVHGAEWPAMVIRYEDLVEKAKASVLELAEFVEGCGLPAAAGVEEAVALAEAVPAGVGAPETAGVGAHHRVLAQVLDQLGGRHAGGRDAGDYDLPALMEAVAGFYDQDYYGTSYDKSGVPYGRDEKLWVDLFAAIAGAIVASIGPRTVLDVGCASGMLVEALRGRGVDARGIDISDWAIGQVPAELRPFCRVGSITDELDGHYDLITCSEVLEHLPPSLAAESVANLCRHADAVLFSSTPSHFDEPTHLNVEPGGYWAQLFYRQGFVRDVDYDASYLAPHAVLFRQRSLDTESLIVDYERALSVIAANLGAHVEDAVAEHDRLAERHNALARESRAVTSERDALASQVERLRSSIGDLERRRTAETLAAFETVRHYEAGQRALAALVGIRDAELEAVRRTKTFRYTQSLRKVYSWVRRTRAPVVAAPAPAHPPDGTYDLWVERYDTLDDAGRARIADGVARLAHRPRISVIMPVYDTPPDLLRAAIESVRAQLYTDWELCIADDHSSAAHVGEILAEYGAVDARIKVARRDVNGHISAASNTALSMATGEWVACLDHDDTLAEHALALAAMALGDRPDAGIVYSDEDKLDGEGRRHSPFFKPDFDPLLLMGENYLSHCMFRRDLVAAVGGYREGYEGSQDWDLALRVTERLEPAQVVHIPHVLYHWRAHAASTASLVSAKPYAVDAGRRAVTDHLARTGRAGQVRRVGKSGHNRVTWALPDPLPLVSIIVPTRDGTLLQRCLDSVLSFTTYPNFEVVVVDNSSRTLSTLGYLQAIDDRLTVIRDERPFNYSAINNSAVRQATGEIVCLLNDDTEVISGDWLTEMVGHVLQPGVGAVGAKLYYDNGRIQHAGVILGILGVAGHSHRMFDRLESGYFGRLQVAQNVSAVTAACVVVRRSAWEHVGGLDEANLAVAFNDVDFCLRLREAGWGVVWTPNAELFHHESISRGPDDQGHRVSEFAREGDYMQKRWGPSVLRFDPFYNPNLSLDAEDFSLAWPPRVGYP